MWGHLRAPNPGPLTLSGSNTWLIGRDPCWVVDPGPAIDAHLDAVAAEVSRRGGAGGIALTHDHGDHSDGVPGLLARLGGGVPVAAARGSVDVALAEGSRFGPLSAVATPGHAPDHLAFVAEGVCCTGDTVLGEGSVFVAPEPGALRAYLEGLERLLEFELEVLLPGHGPPVRDPAARLRGYIDHRLERERLLVAALEAGARTPEAMLDAAWADVPAVLRFAARLTLTAHLHKLAEEGRLPDGVQWP